MEILHFEDLGDTSVTSECSLGVNLVIESNRTFTYGDIAFRRFGGYECRLAAIGSCSSPRRVSNFNSKVAQGGIYLHIKFKRDRLNIFRVKSVHVI